ncbi:MAG: hypothetical protein AB7S36_19240, partial [Planctomycetota bacterium]
MPLLRLRVAALLLVLPCLCALLVLHAPGLHSQDPDTPDTPGPGPVWQPGQLPTVASADWQFSPPSMTVGSRLDITLPSLADGKPVSLRQYRGQNV